MQERVFGAQHELAADRRAPLFLHEGGAHARFLTILGRYCDTLPRTVVHCFTGTRDELRAYLDLDLHIGAGDGSVMSTADSSCAGSSARRPHTESAI